MQAIADYQRFTHIGTYLKIYFFRCENTPVYGNNKPQSGNKKEKIYDKKTPSSYFHSKTGSERR